MKPPKQYDTYLQWIRTGGINHEGTARDYASQHGFSLDGLAQALAEGRPIHFQRLVTSLGNGVLENEPKTRAFAQQYGYSTDQIEAALPMGRQAAFDKYLGLIAFGGQDGLGQVDSARQLATKHNLSIGELEAVIRHVQGARIIITRAEQVGHPEQRITFGRELSL